MMPIIAATTDPYEGDRVLDAVVEQVEGQRRDQQREPREEDEPPGDGVVVLGRADRDNRTVAVPDGAGRLLARPVTRGTTGRSGPVDTRPGIPAGSTPGRRERTTHRLLPPHTSCTRCVVAVGGV
jgi:hypothetical protein